MARPARTLLAAFLLLISAGSAVASAGDLTVEMNDSRRVGLYGSAANVIVGDSSIADVSMIDSHSLVLTGRSYGRTHLTVLDGQGRTLLDTHVVVVAPDEGRVTVYRGPATVEYNCATRCEAAAGQQPEAQAAQASAAPEPHQARAASAAP